MSASIIMGKRVVVVGNLFRLQLRNAIYWLSPPQHIDILFCFFFLNLFEKEHKKDQRTQVGSKVEEEIEREGEVDSPLSREPHAGPNPRTLSQRQTLNQLSHQAPQHSDIS